MLKGTKPEQKIDLTFTREGQSQTVAVTLAWRPSEVVQPESGTPISRGKSIQVAMPEEHDPFSYLLTLWQVDDQKLRDNAELDAELQGVRLRSSYWTGKQVDADTVEFTRPLTNLGLEAVKRYRLCQNGRG